MKRIGVITRNNQHFMNFVEEKIKGATKFSVHHTTAKIDDIEYILVGTAEALQNKDFDDVITYAPTTGLDLDQMREVANARLAPYGRQVNW